MLRLVPETVVRLLAVEDFALAQTTSGFLAVTDRSVPTRIHRAKCAYLHPEHFEEKVVRNAGRRGGYFWALEFETLTRRFTARMCGVCRPGIPF